MAVKEYQQELKELLKNHFSNEDVKTEWRTKMKKGLYSPRVDVAIGPFAVDEGVRYTLEHSDMFNRHLSLFHRLVEQHLINLNIITEDTSNEQKQFLMEKKMQEIQWTNLNGRCFLAIEVENKISRKHLMGGAVNAAVLGKIGIAVGFTKDKHKAFLNLYRYFQFLKDVEKPTFKTDNLLIISASQLVDILDN
ncbi:MAG: hypothetical protein BGO54_13865 [Sphingobacteriales bacterium 46-32]|nr:MAG: hypothetical protein BGO54_13865 [Sphingobacteriales bacterium 46-32]